MKGLEEYIAKHGRHFTEDLVRDAIFNRWSSLEIDRSSRDMVYYNVSSATLGDITYLANLHYQMFKIFHPSKARCIKIALRTVGNVNANGFAFNHWMLENLYGNIDLREYV